MPTEYVRQYTTRVARKIWAPGDTYLEVRIYNVQVFEIEGFSEGDEVDVEIKLTKKEYNHD